MSRVRTAVTAALSVALSVCALSAGAAVASASAGPASAATASAPTEAACIREGLAPISVNVHTLRGRVEGAGFPTLIVRWSGKPLAPGCDARRTVAVQATAWFPHLRFPFNQGFELPWLEFWNGHKAVRSEEWRLSGPIFQGLGCVLRARARLRYEVITADGSVLGRRVVRVPAEFPPCAD
jgi:hypothetical protein